MLLRLLQNAHKVIVDKESLNFNFSILLQADDFLTAVNSVFYIAICSQSLLSPGNEIQTRCLGKHRLNSCLQFLTLRNMWYIEEILRRSPA